MQTKYARDMERANAINANVKIHILVNFAKVRPGMRHLIRYVYFMKRVCSVLLIVNLNMNARITRKSAHHKMVRCYINQNFMMISQVSCVIVHDGNFLLLLASKHTYCAYDVIFCVTL
jgi:hypothetical protein